MRVTRINNFEATESMATHLHTFLMSIVPLIEQSQGYASCQLHACLLDPDTIALASVVMGIDLGCFAINLWKHTGQLKTELRKLEGRESALSGYSPLCSSCR
jgi:hypothetical protein